MWAFYLLAGLVALGGLFGASILANGRKWLKAKIENEHLERIAVYAYDTVAELMPLVNDLKEAAADGKITKAEGEHIKQKALNKLKKRLGLGWLLGEFGSEAKADEVLGAKIEAAVRSAKALEKK
jgi:hypothetical protein